MRRLYRPLQYVLGLVLVSFLIPVLLDLVNNKWDLSRRVRLEEFSQARYPSPSRYEKANDEEKAAIDTFWQNQAVKPEEADPEEGEEL